MAQEYIICKFISFHDILFYSLNWVKYRVSMFYMTVGLSLFVYLRNKTSVPVFYRGNKIWVRVRVRVRMNLITRAHKNEYPYFNTAIKHRYRCFISILAPPYISNVLH